MKTTTVKMGTWFVAADGSAGDRGDLAGVVATEEEAEAVKDSLVERGVYRAMQLRIGRAGHAPASGYYARRSPRGLELETEAEPGADAR